MSIFSNNIQGDKNKIKITQSNNKNDKGNVIIEIIIGVIITVVGGLILFFITK